jgi:two-component system chemotaxis response regulator CheY
MSTILIVDDDRSIRLLMRQIAIKQEHQVITASDGERAFSVLEDNPEIQVVITDMQMPNMKGDQLVKRIRADERFAKIPIIMVSGFVQAHEVKDLLAMGVDRFVPKPIDTRQMAIYINDMFETAQQRAA